jgi:hypothetical protein
MLVSAYGELLRDEAQQAAIKRMEALQAEGNSLRKIAETMEAEGVNMLGFRSFDPWHKHVQRSAKRF